MRLVDADTFEEESRNRLDMQDLYLPIHIKELVIDDMPTIDAVPIIRCKDCKYWDSEITQTAVPNMRSCIYWGKIGTLGIDYCSRAVRKEE